MCGGRECIVAKQVKLLGLTTLCHKMRHQVSSFLLRRDIRHDHVDQLDAEPFNFLNINCRLSPQLTAAHDKTCLTH
jgi:hypothetical protein